jgi:hypothetical protein
VTVSRRPAPGSDAELPRQWRSGSPHLPNPGWPEYSVPVPTTVRFLSPADATAGEFAYHLHSDIGDGFLHAIDCRDSRQAGADTVLDHRDVVEVVSTNQ